jgi:predicted  nucleic acid-binding Zn-ribbon protein
MSEGKFLSKDDLSQIKELHYEEALGSKDIILAELRIAKAKAELNLMSAQYTLKNKEITALVEDLDKTRKELLELRTNHEGFLSVVREKMEIKTEKWGFDPLTGEIKDE